MKTIGPILTAIVFFCAAFLKAQRAAYIINNDTDHSTTSQVESNDFGSSAGPSVSTGVQANPFIDN